MLATNVLAGTLGALWAIRLMDAHMSAARAVRPTRRLPACSMRACAQSNCNGCAILSGSWGNSCPGRSRIRTPSCRHHMRWPALRVIALDQRFRGARPPAEQDTHDCDAHRIQLSASDAAVHS